MIWPNLLHAKRGIPFHDFGLQHRRLARKIKKAQQKVLKENQLHGYKRIVSSFEHRFAQYCSSEHAVSLGSGTDALYFALKSLNIGSGDEVITVANTFISTITSIRETGATCIFVDIDPSTGLMDINKVGALINDKTRAIVPVHMYGNMVDMASLTSLSKNTGLYIVEDACQAIGAKQLERSAGTWGDIGCFSFHITKLVGSPADGGMLVTNNDAVNDKVRKMAEPQWPSHSEHSELINQHRFPSRLAAFSVPYLATKLDNLKNTVALREEQCLMYQRSINTHSEIQLLSSETTTSPAYRNFILLSQYADNIQLALKKSGLPSQRIYPKSLEFLQIIDPYRKLLPATWEFQKKHLALPLGLHINKTHQQEILTIIENVVKTPASEKIELSEKVESAVYRDG